MSDLEDKLNQLEWRLDELLRTQISFQENVNQIRYEISVLRAIEQKRTSQPKPVERQPGQLFTDQPYRTPKRPDTAEPYRATPHASASSRTESPTREEPQREVPPPRFAVPPPSVTEEQPREESAFYRYVSDYAVSARANLEEFIGENLISKIGIIVLLLGIGIGVKYSIDNNLISPLTRIILGYAFGFGLVGFAIRVRKKYPNFSAVLFSGGMAAMYFVTYFAYALYSLIGQIPAFGLMVMFTTFAVAAALVYSRQVIAHIGLVGAYAVPFLLSNNSGAYAFLFTYVSIVNAGILSISIKRSWRPMLYTASGFTWLIFLAWFVSRFSAEQHFYLALTFLWLFFAIFYAANIILRGNEGKTDDAQSLVTAVGTVGIFFAFCLGLSNTIISTQQAVVLLSYLAGSALLVQMTANVRAIEIAGARKLLFYVASAFTWATFLAWFSNKYSPAEHFGIGLVFLGVFFTIFYFTRIMHAVSRPEDDKQENLVSAIITTMIFYGFAFGISNSNVGNQETAVLFWYLSAISVAILVTSYKYYGRFMVMVSYPFAWLIYGSWFLQHYRADANFDLAVTFALLFFAVFYATTLIYRLITDEIGIAEHAGLMLTNSFIFYGFGYAIMDSREDLKPYEGLFTAANGVFHFLVAQTIMRLKSKASDVAQVLTVLIITFLTITIPVQFDGNRVTMIWAVEGALLFWLARLRQIRVFEYFSYPVMALATGSLFVDWTLATLEWITNPSEFHRQVFANGNFVTAVIILGAFTSIFFVNRNGNLLPTISERIVRPFGWVVAALTLFVLFNTLRIEIVNYFHLLSVAASGGQLPFTTAEIGHLSVVWQIIYAILFFAALDLINLYWVRSRPLAGWAAGFSVLAVVTFVAASLIVFPDLRLAYMTSPTPQFADISIRYFGYAAIGILFFALYRVSKSERFIGASSAPLMGRAFDGLFHVSLLVLASGELINLMIQYHISNSNKYGLSILWGVYALALIGAGIKRTKKHLRIGAIVLLGITLVKLFVYDIADLPTIPKTILFVSLGILMLIVSFLYAKYKHVIFGEPDEQKL